MYDRMLDTFITAADCGSFTKAAEKLFISPTAVMKQINSLESRLGLKLAERTSAGIRLTASGRIIYDSAKHIIEYSGNAVSKAAAAACEGETVIRIGTSVLNPARSFVDLWYRAGSALSEYNLHLVPFEDNSSGIVSEIKQLGEKFDILIGVCDSKVWLSLCSFLPIGRYKKMAAVSRRHRLADRSSLNMTDMYGETLMMVKEGDSPQNDRIRREITEAHPQIHIEDTPRFYDISVFNRCAETDNILLTLECWKDVHPGLVTIPIDLDYSIPYGILYPDDSSPETAAFIDCVRKIQ